MSDDEFALFLKSLDTEILKWKEQLSQVDIRSSALNEQDAAGLQSSYKMCLQSLNDARKEIDSLSQKQTLKLDFLLLVDLNESARNLDELTRDLIDVSDGRAGAAVKSLDYARGVLRTDAALTSYLSQFQRHILALAAMFDAVRDQAEDEADAPTTQNDNSRVQGPENDTNPPKEQLR
jgi:hypothetical protein